MREWQAVEKATGEAKKALDKAQKPRHSALVGVFSLHATISAPEQAWQYEQALTLPHTMCKTGLTAHLTKLNSAILACLKGVQGMT